MNAFLILFIELQRERVPFLFTEWECERIQFLSKRSKYTVSINIFYFKNCKTILYIILLSNHSLYWKL
jgi:hypothetical protein